MGEKCPTFANMNIYLGSQNFSGEEPPKGIFALSPQLALYPALRQPHTQSHLDSSEDETDTEDYASRPSRAEVNQRLKEFQISRFNSKLQLPGGSAVASQLLASPESQSSEPQLRQSPIDIQIYYATIKSVYSEAKRTYRPKQLRVLERGDWNGYLQRALEKHKQKTQSVETTMAPLKENGTYESRCCCDMFR